MTNKSPQEIATVLDNSHLVSSLIDLISKSTFEQLEKDTEALIEKFEQTYPSIKFKYFVEYPDTYKEVSDEFKEELKNLIYIKGTIDSNFLLIQTHLSLLMVRSSIHFPNEMDAKTAFFKCLPEYFSTESFLKELMEDQFNIEDFNSIAIKSYVDDSLFVAENKVTGKLEEALMFFVGSQLVNDLFL